MGGKVFSHKLQWQGLTNDKWLLGIVNGNVLFFESLPAQSSLPRPICLSLTHHYALDAALLSFLEKKIIEKCEVGNSAGFFSNVFPTFKKDGSARVILNLKELNNYVQYSHFKMDSIQDVLQLVQPNCFFATVYFKDALYSVAVKPKNRIWLRFMWGNEPFQFTCLPQGLSSAPRTFTKLLKPVLSHFRTVGITVSCYIDDCIFTAASERELRDNLRYAVRFFDSVGLTVNLSNLFSFPRIKWSFLEVY